MSGFKRQLQAFLGKEKIARLGLTEEDSLQFLYTPEWQAKGFALSPHLPLDNRAAENSHAIRAFFQNVFPEGENFDVLLQSYHLSRNNIFGITQALGSDLPGALRMLPEGVPERSEASFRLIQPSEISERLRHYSAGNLLVWDGKPRLSLAGVHQKINVLINEAGEMGFGEGSLCSTHILKFERSPEQHLVFNEYLMMNLAKKLGLSVAEVELRYFDAFPTLLVTRFDRSWLHQGKVSTVQRRHMMDGCQALNLLPDYKYERNLGSGRDVRGIREGASFPALFAFCEQCKNPAMAKKQLLIWALFNAIIGNWDAHAKNLSFFISASGIEITPAYDLLSIRPYPEFSQELSMAFGDEFDAKNIGAYALADFADSCGLSRAVVAQILDNVCKQVLVHLQELRPLASNAAQEAFLQEVSKQIAAEAEHLQDQAGKITAVEL